MLFEVGGNVYNVMFNVNAVTLRGLTSFILCLLSENHSVHNSPLGGGGL